MPPIGAQLSVPGRAPLPCKAPPFGEDGIHFEFQRPPPALADYVSTFFLLRTEAGRIEDVQPAGLAVLAFFLSGEGTLVLPDGERHDCTLANVLTPMAAAARVEVRGPWHVFGAALSPLGWAALTRGLSAAELGNRLCEAGSLMGVGVRQLGAQLAAAHATGESTLKAMVAQTVPVLQRRLQALPEAHVRLVGEVLAWLGSAMSPQVDALYARGLYSPRQLQRLVDRYFGLPPMQLARKHRALRAAALLADPRTTARQAAAVAQAFYDQSHMIRELRLFVGRTPARLAEEGLPALAAILALRPVRRC